MRALTGTGLGVFLAVREEDTVEGLNMSLGLLILDRKTLPEEEVCVLQVETVNVIKLGCCDFICVGTD